MNTIDEHTDIIAASKSILINEYSNQESITGTSEPLNNDSATLGTSKSDILDLHMRQKQFFAKGLTHSVEFRKLALKNLLQSVKAHEEHLYRALKADLGRPRQEAFISDIGIIEREVKLALKHIDKWAKPKKTSTPLVLGLAKSKIYPTPRGQILNIAPWNYPIQLSLVPLITAIAAGNCMTIKPSEFTPNCTRVIKMIITKAFAPEFVNVVEGAVEESKILLDLKWDHIFFTGSPNVGKIIAAAAAKHLTPVTLELGGKSPCIINQDANLKIAARRIMWGKFFNCGQTCLAPDYLIVHKSIKSKFLALCKEMVKGFYGDHPQTNPDYGRVVSSKHTERLVNIMQGEQIYLGGSYDIQDRFIEPTIIDNASLDSPVMQEEIFGPILPVMEFSSSKDVIEIINKNSHPLGFYVFSEDKNFTQPLIEALPFGGGCINHVLCHHGNDNLPFGGVGNSGYGAYHGEFGFKEFSHYKPVLDASTKLDPPLAYAPYKKNFNILKRLFSWV